MKTVVDAFPLFFVYASTDAQIKKLNMNAIDFHLIVNLTVHVA